MNKILSLLLTVIFSLVSEILLRRLGEKAEADLAEGAYVAAAVTATQQMIDLIPNLPQWVKDPLKNPVMLGNLAKWADDAIEANALKGLDQLQLPFYQAGSSTTTVPSS